MSGACATLGLYLGKLHTLLDNIKLGGKGLPGTNAQAYFVTPLALKTKVLQHLLQVSIIYNFLSSSQALQTNKLECFLLVLSRVFSEAITDPSEAHPQG
jgi:hypothetical protein